MEVRKINGKSTKHNIEIPKYSIECRIAVETEEMRLMYLFMKSRSAFSTILYGKIFPKNII